MSELEFENKVNDYLKKIINDESYFSSGDFYNFYDNMLNSINVSNINELLSNFNYTDKERYYKFYDSVNYLYLYLNGFINISKRNINELAKEVLSSGEDIDLYLDSLIRKNIGLIDKSISDVIIENHNNIVLESSFLEKSENIVNSIKKEYLKIFDIKLLSLYLENSKYDVLEYVSDEVFSQLSDYQIKDILINGVKHTITNSNKINLNDLSSNKIQYILSLFNIKSIININRHIGLDVFFKELEYISDDELNYLIKNDLLNGIENCKYVLNNSNYVKKIINSRYSIIFNYLSIDQIDDEMLNSLDYNLNFDTLLYDSSVDDNLSNLLKYPKIFASFSRNISDRGRLLNEVGYENVTREFVLFCMLDGMTEDELSTNLNDSLLYDKVIHYYSHTLDDIKYALECGYKCSRQTIQLTEEEKNLFIENGQPEIIDYNGGVSFDMIKYATLKGHKFDRNLYDLLHCKGNFHDLLKELVIYNLENNNKDFCDSVLIYFASSFSIMRMNYLLNIYKDDLVIQKYLEFSKKTLLNLHLNNKDEIYKYFDESGPTKYLYERALFDDQLFNSLKNNDDFLNCFMEDKSIMNYINFIKNSYKWLELDSKDQIYKYFNEFGPSDKFYDEALIDSFYFNIFLEHYNLVKHYENDPVIINYFHYLETYFAGLINFINDKDEIYKYFNESGPSKNFYDDFLFDINSDFSDLFFSNSLDDLKKYYGDDVLSYSAFIYKFGKIFNFITKDNVSLYFDSEGVSENLKAYLKDNKKYTSGLLRQLAHNNQVIDNLDYNFVSIFEPYILDNYFKNIDNAKEKFNYLLNNLGSDILFNLNNDSVVKLINLDYDTLVKLIDTIKCCTYEDVPKNVLYNNVSISLCKYTFKMEHSDIVNIFTNIKSVVLNLSIEEIADCFNDNIYNDFQKKLNYYYSMMSEICSKDEFYKIIVECKNLNEDSLHILCRKYLELCENKYLEENKDTILNKFGIPLSYDRDDSIKKLSIYFKNYLNYESFVCYRNDIIKNQSFNWDSLKDNDYLDSLGMTKGEYNIILSISEEEFNLIMSALKEKRKPDDSVKGKFKLFNRFISLLSSYSFENNNEILKSLNPKMASNLELEDMNMFQVLKEMDIDVFIHEVINNEKILLNLRNCMKNKFIGRLPNVIGYKFSNTYGLELIDGINNIGLFLTKYSQILERKKMLLKMQGVSVESFNINMSFIEIIEQISAVNSETLEVKRLFGSSEYSDFAANPERNSNSFPRIEREEKLVKLADYLYTLDKVTIPSKDFIIENNDGTKKINFIVGNRTNPANICHGERTGACMRIGGIGEGLFLKCNTDKNWFHIRIEDPYTHEYISRVSGFRKGNSVFLNQLRDSCEVSKYTNTDLQEFITIYAHQLIEETKDSKYPIENVFINDQYAMEGYNAGNSKLYSLGYEIKDEYNLDDVIDLKLRNSNDIWCDVLGGAYLLATSDGKKNDNGFIPLKGSHEDTCIYDSVRDKTYGLYMDEELKHFFVTVNQDLLMEKINRVNAMKEKLLGKDYRYEITDLLYDSSLIIDGYASSDFYVFIDKDYIIYCDYIESINKDGNIIPYNQGMNAKNEMDKYVEILKNRYNLMEVRHAI